MAFGEVTLGVTGTAAPLFDLARSPLGALCLTLRHEDADNMTRQRLLARVPEAAGLIGERLRIRHQ